MKYQNLVNILQTSRSAVFFGGAGVSTESGVPDFRSETGLYAAQSVYGYAPEELLSHTLFAREPELFFRYYKENLIYRDAKPNAAHIALAKLEHAGKLAAVVTQNVDGLHQAAGSVNVLELHGSNHRQFCMACGNRYDLEYILNTAYCDGVIPKCEICGGTVRPDVVLYEEPLDHRVMDTATRAIAAADCLIVGGSSLAVYPAAGLLHYFHGSHLALINKSATPFDEQADLVIHESIGAVFSAVIKEMCL